MSLFKKQPRLDIPGLASPYRRLVGRLIDLAVGGFVIFPLSLMIIGPLSQVFGESESEKTIFGLLSMVIMILFLIAYDTLMTALAGRTLGMMALGLRVVDVNGNKPGWGPSLLRAFLLYLFGLLILFGIVITASILGWVFFAGLGRYQTFPHDTATKTYVMMKTRAAGPVQVQPLTQAPVTPHDDLEKLRDSGIISEEEYQRKRKEMGY